mgnify:CR=1 FL=1
MAEASERASQTEDKSDRLDSWKEIAAYLNRDVTTVQRWEKREGMPVHRHQHDRAGTVFASRAELDHWVRTRKVRPEQDDARQAEPVPEVAAPPVGAPKRRRNVRLLLAAFGALAVAAGLSLWNSDGRWRNPIDGAQYQLVADFDGIGQDAAISPDGQFVAFLSERGGTTDVWLTQIGTGQFHNLTHGRIAELVNPSIRSVGFSPDGSLVTFWTRKPSGGDKADINIWAVPVLGGEPRPYLEGAAEYAWSQDGSRLAYHTPGPGDPLFVSDGLQSKGRNVFAVPIGQHSHFPVWGLDGKSIYLVQGMLPDKLGIWRIAPEGGSAARVTSQNSRVSHPVPIDGRTMLYLATDPDGSGPWLYSLDLRTRVSRRVSSGIDRYTSVATSANGRRLVATLASPKRTLWRMRLGESEEKISAADPIALSTQTGHRPRLGPNFMVYVAGSGSTEGMWKFSEGKCTELWRGQEARIIGGPAVSGDGGSIAFSVEQAGRKMLYVMRADGSEAHVITDSLNLEGDPAWTPDGQAILSAVTDGKVPHLFRISLTGKAENYSSEYSVDPSLAPDGSVTAFSGADVGTTFPVKVVRAGTARSLLNLNLTRGARHLSFLLDGRSLVFLQGDIRHKDLWRVDLDTGAQVQLTHFPPDFEVRDFDISRDGREVVVQRVQERSEVVVVDLRKR